MLAFACLPCGLRLWRAPSDRAAWISLLAISGLMTLLHLGMRPQGAMLATVLAVPAGQFLLLGLAALIRRRSAVPDPSRA